MTAYTKYPVGNKRFVIEWFLEVDNNEVSGDPFECVDCQLLSISARTVTLAGDPVLAKSYVSNASNFGAALGEATIVSVVGEEGTYLVPAPAELYTTTPKPFLPPPTRWLAARLEGGGGEGHSRISALFEIL